MGSHELTVDGDLHGVIDDAYAGDLAAIPIPDAVAGPGEAHRAGSGFDSAENLVAACGRGGRGGLAAVEPLIVGTDVAFGVRGDEHLVMLIRPLSSTRRTTYFGGAASSATSPSTTSNERVAASSKRRIGATSPIA